VILRGIALYVKQDGKAHRKVAQRQEGEGLAHCRRCLAGVREVLSQRGVDAFFVEGSACMDHNVSLGTYQQRLLAVFGAFPVYDVEYQRDAQKVVTLVRHGPPLWISALHSAGYSKGTRMEYRKV